MRRWLFLFIALAGLALLNFLIYQRATASPGFPLDDTWIHQTYARNLGLRGEMAFNPGEPSTGSTSLAWTALLALGYFLRLPPLPWAYFWGSAFAVGSAMLTCVLGLRYFGNQDKVWIIAGICMLEWHLAWAALSGMEISQFTFLTLLYIWLMDKVSRPVWLGLTAGLLVLTRPEGLLLAATYGLKWFRLLPDRKRALSSAIGYVLPLSLLVGPLAAFNWRFGGHAFPNTVYAKYLVWGYPWTPSRSLHYLGDVALYFFQGPLMLLVPCAAAAAYGIVRQRQYRLTVPLIWMGGLIGLYSIALPALYHHGRYLMPLIPLVVLLGAGGLQSLSARFNQWRLFWPAYKILIGATVTVLWWNGASTYSTQVNFLAKNQLEDALWIESHTPPDAIVATHDVGLMGYYSRRRIVDLAGLITPEVIPLLRDQHALARFCTAAGVDYVAVFTGYYRPLLQDLNAAWVFSPGGAATLRQLNLEPFEVYSLK